ncbi:MAG: hypothetical protein KF782_10455 [Labilithrix sp.]|nr:hypothetical protein [Labilithrix sp.]
MQALVFPNKYVLGWPKVDDARAVRAEIGDILSSRYSSDAHFVAYAADVERRHTIALFQDRANAGLITRANLRMTLAVFDVDGPQHATTSAWSASESEKLPRLFDAHPGGFVYVTRGGYRIVYALAKPSPIRYQADDDAWTARYRSWIRYLARRFEIHADAACADWTRFYRCPHATRDGVLQELGTFGDTRALGPWVPKLERSDRIEPKVIDGAVYGAVEPVPISDPSNEYGQRRIEAAMRYLETAPLSIKHEGGRTTMFKVCAVLVRRMRLPLDLAADCIEAIYLPRLAAAGTAVWSHDTPGPHGMSVMERLEKARDTGHVPPGDIMSEELWNEIQRNAA